MILHSVILSDAPVLIMLIFPALSWLPNPAAPIDEIREEMKYQKVPETVLNEVDKRFKDNMVSDKDTVIWLWRCSILMIRFMIFLALSSVNLDEHFCRFSYTSVMTFSCHIQYND